MPSRGRGQPRDGLGARHPFDPDLYPPGATRSKTARPRLKRTLVALATLAAFAPAQPAVSCSRAMYEGPNGTVVTTRSSHRIGSQGTHLWRYPRGLERDGAASPGTLTWTSRYGSVTTAGWDIATIDGLNEKGLAANMIYLAESDYGKPAANDRRKPISTTAWGQ